MPLNANPNATIPYVLLTDRELPEPRPAFLLRYLTAAEAANLEQQATAIGEAKNNQEARERLEAIIRVGLADVRGVKFRGEPVAIDKPLREYLADSELEELARAVRKEPELDAEKKRASASSAQSDKASCASDAPADDASTLPARVPQI